jgi:hypothetical protein
MKLNFIKERLFTGPSRVIAVLAFLCGFLLITTITKTNQGDKDERDIESLKAIHYRDSVMVTQLTSEVNRMMTMMQKGAAGQDTFYFVDKNKSKFMITFIKQ